MFARLRHNTIICCNHQQRHVYRADASDHRLDKALVPGHVDNRNIIAHKSKAELNGYAPRLFFRCPIGVRARKRFNEQRFPVVNMSCSSNYRMCHAHSGFMSEPCVILLS